MENPPAWQHVQIIGGVDAVLQPNTRRVIRITYQEKWCAALWASVMWLNLGA
jgi:hypothetical protein